MTEIYLPWRTLNLCWCIFHPFAFVLFLTWAPLFSSDQPFLDDHKANHSNWPNCLFSTSSKFLKNAFEREWWRLKEWHNSWRHRHRCGAVGSQMCFGALHLAPRACRLFFLLSFRCSSFNVNLDLAVCPLHVASLPFAPFSKRNKVKRWKSGLFRT